MYFIIKDILGDLIDIRTCFKIVPLTRRLFTKKKKKNEGELRSSTSYVGVKKINTILNQRLLTN